MSLYNPNQSYQQRYQATPAFMPQSSYNYPTDTGIIWVQGESGAKAYPVQAGKSLVLFDAETEHFFIKSVDISGMPQPLRVFSYSEAAEVESKHPEIDTSMFITREEFQQAIDQLTTKYTQRPLGSEATYKGGKGNGKSLIQSAE